MVDHFHVLLFHHGGGSCLQHITIHLAVIFSEQHKSLPQRSAPQLNRSANRRVIFPAPPLQSNRGRCHCPCVGVDHPQRHRLHICSLQPWGGCRGQGVCKVGRRLNALDCVLWRCAAGLYVRMRCVWFFWGRSFVGDSGMPVPLLTTAALFSRPVGSKCSLGLKPFPLDRCTIASDLRALATSPYRTGIGTSPFGLSLSLWP